MFYLVLGLIAAAFIARYLIGWVRGKKGLAKIPFTVDKGGVHRFPLILVALLAASALASCSTEYRPPAKAPADTTAAADSAHHGDRGKGHDKDKHKDKDHDHDGKP